MRAISAFALIVACSMALSAQTAQKAPTPAPAKASTTVETVKKAQAAFMAARAKQDATAIAGMLDDGWVMVRWNGTTATKAEFLDEVKTGKSSYEVVTPHSETVRMHGNTAVVTTHHTFKQKMLDGKIVTDTNRSVFIWANENGQWKMISIQGTLAKAPGK